MMEFRELPTQQGYGAGLVIDEGIEKGRKIGQITSPSSLRGPLTESEIQKVANFYLKIGKGPGPDNIQAELIKTMPLEQLHVVRL